MEGEWWSVGLQPACSRTRIRAFQLCMQRHDTLEGLARGMVMMASRKHVSFQILWCVDCQAQYCCDIDTGCIKICWRYMFSSSMHGM